MDAVKAGVKAAGDYTVSEVDVRAYKFADGTTMTADQAAVVEKPTPNTKMVTTTTTTETATTDAEGNTVVKKEVKVKKIKTASKTTSAPKTK